MLSKNDCEIRTLKYAAESYIIILSIDYMFYSLYKHSLFISYIEVEITLQHFHMFYMIKHKKNFKIFLYVIFVKIETTF